MIDIRALEAAEWEIFRDLRLEALQSAPGVFATAYQDAVKRPPASWQAAISGPSHQVFGLFDGDRLIGIKAAFTDQDDPTGATAILVMSFIAPAYRRRGLSALLYRARLDWIGAQRQFRRVVVSHRRSNAFSSRAIQGCGFIQTGASPRLWPDGQTEDEVFYGLPLGVLD